ncbi:hypothetical protein F4810DRAFT_478843 [Camillea tinctor]|nr:hypothetical protein F4810DRAFT_478843 [Camillea tinctor]
MSSSPLAAMHPAPVQAWGQHRKMRSPTINMRNTLLLTEPDYFSDQQVRGSSPSLSLAADLSENFRIDNEASPRFPTPRRALFPRNAGTRAYVTTTPPHQKDSSPMSISMEDAMEVDMTPIPEKRACSTVVEIISPTPMQSPGDEMMMESPIPPSRQGNTLEAPKLFAENRRRAGLRRPSLTKTKGYTTSTLLTRGSMDGPSTSQPLRLGQSPNMTLGECFEGSPPRSQSATTPCRGGAGSRSKTLFAGLSNSRDIRTGTPVSQHSRRPSNPTTRSRRRCQRARSMYDNVEDLDKSDDSLGQSGDEGDMEMDDDEWNKRLPHFFDIAASEYLPRMSADTFVDLMDGKFNDPFDQKLVVDCRFEYEYEGGHIDGAINYWDHELMMKHLFQVPLQGRTLLILHCEFSAHRAPLMARAIREFDRELRKGDSPKLLYPHVFVLDGGYHAFFKQYRSRCYPQGYIEMNDPKHLNTCERQMDRVSAFKKGGKRKGLNRAQTYAFGVRDAMVLDDSPTGPPRRVEHQSPIRMIGNSPILGRSPRRFASY